MIWIAGVGMYEVIRLCQASVAVMEISNFDFARQMVNR